MQWQGRLDKKQEEGNDEDASKPNLPVRPFFSSGGDNVLKEKVHFGHCPNYAFPSQTQGGPLFRRKNDI